MRIIYILALTITALVAAEGCLSNASDPEGLTSKRSVAEKGAQVVGLAEAIKYYDAGFRDKGERFYEGDTDLLAAADILPADIALRIRGKGSGDHRAQRRIYTVAVTGREVDQSKAEVGVSFYSKAGEAVVILVVLHRIRGTWNFVSASVFTRT